MPQPREVTLDDFYKDDDTYAEFGESIQRLLKRQQGRDGRDGIDGKHGKDGKNGAPGLHGLDGESGKDGKDGKDGRHGKDGLNGVDGNHGNDGKDGKDGSPDEPEHVIAKIHKSKVKIKRSAIEGMDELENLARSADANAAKILRRGSNAILNVKQSGGKDNNIDTIEFVGATVSPIGNGNKVQVIVAAGALSIIAVTGTIDDSNVTFTAASQPTLLNINGSFYQQTGGAYTWTYVGGTITLSSAVGTGGAIFGI